MNITFPDHLTRSGAEALAARLDAYWHGLGHAHVQHTAVEIPVALSKMGGEAWTVRSNLVNGLPPRVRERETSKCA